MDIKKILKSHKAQFGIVLAVAFFLPMFVKDASVTHIMILVLLYVILSMGLEIALGITDLFSLCHAAFYGMGAYVSALLSIYLGWSFWVTLPIATICAGLFGFLIGLPALRTNGDYLAIATLGFGEIFRLILVNGGDFTRGPRGLTGIARPELFGLDFTNKNVYYYIILAATVLIFLVVYNIPRTFFGRALMAIRDDEAAAAFMGIQISKYKVTAFTLSGMIAGIAGAFYAHYICYISPDTFVYNDSITILTMVLIGGGGTVIGPVVGAVILTILPELLRSFVEYRMLIYGLVVVVMMQIRPMGILGHLNIRISYLERRLKKNQSDSGKGKEV